jgi:hypothetical protein
MTTRPVTAAIAILIGLLLTWATGMYPTPFTRIQIDVVTYGAPLPYSTRVIPTEFITYDWFNLALDLAFWAIITYLILAVILRTSPPKKPEQ